MAFASPMVTLAAAAALALTVPFGVSDESSLTEVAITTLAEDIAATVQSDADETDESEAEDATDDELETELDEDDVDEDEDETPVQTAPAVVRVSPTDAPTGVARVFSAVNVPAELVQVRFVIGLQNATTRATDATATRTLDAVVHTGLATAWLIPTDVGSYSVTVWGYNAAGTRVELGHSTFTVSQLPNVAPAPSPSPSPTSTSTVSGQPTTSASATVVSTATSTLPVGTTSTFDSSLPTSDASLASFTHPVAGAGSIAIAMVGTVLTAAGGTLVAHGRRRQR